MTPPPTALAPPPGAPPPAAPPRPTAVLVLGVLNLVFSVLGCFGVASSAVVLVAMPETNPMTEVLKASPGYTAYLAISSFLGLIAAVVLGVAGAAMLQRKRWGRTLSLVHAGYTLIATVVNSGVNVVYVVLPLLDRAGGGAEQMGAAAGAVGGMVGGCFALLYPIACLWFLTRKPVKDYFAALP